MSTQIDLNLLLSSVKKGSNNSFEQLYNTYSPLILSMISHFKDSRLEAEEIDQVSRIALYHAACAYKLDSPVTFGYFAKRCIYNAILDEIRRLDPPSASLDDIDKLDESVGIKHVESDVETIIAYEEAKKKLKETLSETEYIVFISHVEGMKNKEIAEALGSDARSVTVQLSRVRAKLKKIFSEETK